MELRTILFIAIFVGFFVNTHFVSRLYDDMRPPRKPKGEKKNPTASLVGFDLREDKLLTRQLVGRRNAILEETDYTLKENRPLPDGGPDPQPEEKAADNTPEA